MSAGLSILTLAVRDLERSAAFYTAWGFRLSGASQKMIKFFHAGQLALGLYGWDALAEDAGVPPAGDGFRGATIARNMPSKADVDSAIAAAIQAGGSLVKPAHDAFWGGYSGYIADPDGHLWELAYTPFWKLRPDGSAVLPD